MECITKQTVYILLRQYQFMLGDAQLYLLSNESVKAERVIRELIQAIKDMRASISEDLRKK